METPAPYIVNGRPVKTRVECFRLRPKRVRYRFTRRISGQPMTARVSSNR